MLGTIMFTSSIRIITQISYIKALLKKAKNYFVYTQTILLVWQLDKKSIYIILLIFLL